MGQTFEWDEDKRLSNIDKHGIDFIRIRAIFDGRPIVRTSNIRDGERRFATTGEFEGECIPWSGQSGAAQFA